MKEYVLTIWRDNDFSCMTVNDADVAIGTWKLAQATHGTAFLYVTDESGKMERIDTQF